MAARISLPRRSRQGARALLALVAALALVFAGPALTASATGPISLGDGYIADEVGALSPAESASSEERLSALYEATEIDLYVAIVDDFTDPANSQQWADATAAQNGLGVSQYLLAIATDGRQYYISADSAGPLSNDQLDAIERDIRPALSAGDLAGAIDAAAEAIQGTSSSGGGGGVGSWLTWALVLVVALVIVVLVVVLVRRRRKRVPSTGDGAQQPQVPTAELRKQAASALVAMDDALRTSEQELGFAVAQYGEQAAAEFSAALASAREKLTVAFTLQQQLDDGTPDTEEQVRAWNIQIIELCSEASDELDEKAAAFDELRKVEQDAPAALERARAAREAAASGIDAAGATLATLRATYGADALATVDDNVDQARSRIAFADEQLAAAQSALASGDTGQAAVGIRAAEEAVGQADLLEKAIDALAADLPRAEQQSVQLIAALEEDVRVAQSLPDPDGRVAAAVAATRSRVDAARAELTTPQRRPLQTLQQLQEADRAIDEVVQSARDAASRAQRLAQQLDAAIGQARAQISAAESFIAARRGAVGVEARTRVSDASAALARAEQLRATDPDAALRDAARANELAARGIESARSDVGGFSIPDTGRASGSDSFFGAVLGGLISNSLSGGSSRSRSGGWSGGFGGSGWSGSSGRGSSSGGRSSFRSGGFSGGGSRGRRGGGRF
ncbi:TPM domain-containing protein [Microbacterium sp. RD1]|uniref:TPM domain-containing protein n=1 Tax=Microbacterium sp. RD1 TaxID=3457313 RepID=UPI003FA5321F